MPFSPAEQASLRAVVAPFENASTPPGWCFNDPRVNARELSGIWAKDWVAVAHVSEFTCEGAYRTVDAGRLRAIVIRGQDGQLRAFHNSCRHRGTRLLDGTGCTTGLIRCPYHAWSYTTDGALAAVPQPEGLAHADFSALGLSPLKLALFNGWVFVAAEPATALAASLSDFPDLKAQQLDTLVCVEKRDYRVASNWKLIAQNFNECYHCAVAHPALHRISRDADLPGFEHRGRAFTGGPMALEPGVRTMSDNGTFIEPGLPGRADVGEQLVLYFCIYPNLLLTIAPDHVLAHILWPRSATETLVETSWLCSAEQIAADGFSARDAITFWDRTNGEDWALCTRAQAGLAASGHRPGPYHAWERCVHDFDRWYVQRTYADLLAAER